MLLILAKPVIGKSLSFLVAYSLGANFGFLEFKRPGWVLNIEVKDPEGVK
jgi:hypothetical protein